MAICSLKDKEIDRMSEFEEGYWWFVGRRKIIDIILNKEIKNNNLKILDVGCGTGHTTLSLKKFGITFGSDMSFSALKHSKIRGLELIVNSNSTQLPFIENSFDIITMLDVLEHTPNDLEVLLELKKILKKDGRILITVPAYQFLWSEHDVALSHYRRYNSKNLRSVLNKSGFKITRISYFISIIFPLIVIYRLISKLKKSKSNSKAQLIKLPNFIDKILQKILFFESKILDKTNLPCGLSLVCVAKK